MELTKLAETTDTITLGWQPELDGRGYLLWREKSATVPVPSGGTRPTFTQVFDPKRDQAVFSKDSAWYQVVAIGVINEGIYPPVVAPPPPPPPPPPPSGSNVVLVNQKWSAPNGDWGHKELIDVRIMDNSVRRDAIALAGKGTADRVYIEQHSGDGLKIGQAAIGPIRLGSYEEQSQILMFDKTGSVHSDNCQAMGGTNITCIGFYSKKFVSSNSVFFANEGSSENGKPTDIVWEFTVFDGFEGIPGIHPGGVPLKLYDSIRCGMRHGLVVYAATSPGPLDTTPSTVDPVLEDVFSIVHSAYANAGKPKHQQLWSANGARKAELTAMIQTGDAKALNV